MSAPRRALPLVAVATAVLLAVACAEGDRAAADSRGEASAALMEAPVATTPSAPPGNAVGDAFGTGSGPGTRSGFDRTPAPTPGNPRPGRPGSRTETKVGADAEEALQGATRAAVETTSVAQSAMLIRTGHATIEVDTLERAIAAVQEMARRLGGYVANTNLMVGERQPRRAELQLRFPSSRFDEATSALRPLGKVESLVINTEDVGEEYVDMTARMSNARRLEERLIDLLARRAGKLEEMLAVERELARVREEIERYEGRLRYLRSRTSVSTLGVMVHEPAPVFEPRPGPSRIVEAFRQAWRNFVGFLAAIISSLGWVVPLVVIVGGLAWAGRRWLPRPSAPAPTPAPRPTPMPEKRDAA